MKSIRDLINIADAFGTETRNLSTKKVNEDLADDLKAIGIDPSVAAGIESAAGGESDTGDSTEDALDTVQQELEAEAAKLRQQAAEAEAEEKAAAEAAAKAAEEASRAAEEAAQAFASAESESEQEEAQEKVDDVIQRIKELSTDEVITSTVTAPEDEQDFGAGSQGPDDDVAAGIASGGVQPPEVPADQPAGGEETDGLPAPEEEPEVAAEPEIDPDAPGEDNNTNPDMQRPPEDQPAGGEETDGLPEPEAPQTDAELDADSADNAEDPDAEDPRGRDQRAEPEQPQGTGVAANQDAGEPEGVAGSAEPEAPQTDAELDADSADNAPQGDSLANKLDTTTASLMDKYNAGGRKADPAVKDLQTALSRLGFDPNGIDGKYGQGTFKAVQDFQKANGLPADGEAGPNTMKKMQELLNAGTTQPAEPEAPAAEPEAPQTDAELDADSADNAAPAAQQGAATQAQRDAMAANTWDPTKADGGQGRLPANQPNSLKTAADAQRASAPQPRGPLKSFAPWKSKIEALGYKVSPSGMGVTGRDGGTVASINDRGNPFFGSDKIRDIVRGPQPTAAQRAAAEKRQGEENWNAVKGMWNRLTGKRDTPAPVSDRNPPPGKQPQMASKDLSMKNVITESIDECGAMPTSMPQKEGNPVSMNVTLNASGEEHVQDLIRMMQLAGAKDAAPVASMHVGPKDSHDDMAQLMAIASAEQDEGVEEEWDNSPNEDYKDHEYMTKDLSGGINRQKKAYAKAQDGDNAMAVESIKEQLLKALEETGYKK